MITGFNTDIVHDGVTYHVQTEDKGLDTPLILSLVYVGGAILASKRAPYDDLLDSGFDERVLTERLQRQHKLICAAIRAGRIDDLKRMSERGGASPPRGDSLRSSQGGSFTPHSNQNIADRPDQETAAQTDTDHSRANRADVVSPAPEQIPPQNQHEETLAGKNPVDGLRVGPIVRQALESNLSAVAADGIKINLLGDEGEFRAGELITLRIYTCHTGCDDEPIADALITVKILGTTFRPVILLATTDDDGLAVVRALLPRFTTGRAALLVRATAGGHEAELRRIIQQAG